MHIGIVGCGQLSRMLALAGIPMGFKFSFIADPEEDTDCIDNLGPVARPGPSGDMADIYKQLGSPDLFTVEKEQVDLALVKALQQQAPVHPNARAFAACQHRRREKQLLDRLNIPSSAYVYGKPTDGQLSLPAVAKSCRDGYDGKNQWVLKTDEDVQAFCENAEGDDYIIEDWIPFEREVSQVSVRSLNGEVKHYPLTENRHHKGILTQSIAPAPDMPEPLAAQAQDYIERIMEEFDYIGVIAMECFVVEQQLLVNELAPRVHNSGHWTQSGSQSCQFENHIRAITGLPLGSTRPQGVVGMVNLIGTKQAPRKSLSENARLHWYNKSVRPGRKLGHVNFTGSNYADVKQEMQEFQALDLNQLAC